MTILQVEDLRTWFTTNDGHAKAVDGVSFDLEKGRTLAIVGESGCGKTVLATSLMRLFRRSGVTHPSGKIIYRNHDLLQLSGAEMQAVRGRHIALIFQEPMAALNPVMKIGDQIAEPMLRHLKISSETARRQALELLEQLGVPSPDRVMETWPHTLSGGMRQRVAIAMALSCKPDILIADEPTTALDVTVQAQILRLIKDLQKSIGMATILITHDLGVVNEIADDIMVMYSGKSIEKGKVGDVLFDPKHPYTEKLIAAVPAIDAPQQKLAAIEGQVKPATSIVLGCRFADRCEHASERCKQGEHPSLIELKGRQVGCYLYDREAPIKRKMPKIAPTQLPETIEKNAETAAILEVKNLKTWFPVQAGILRRTVAHVKAVDDVSFSLNAGQTLAVVGESGCGKSTLGQTLLRLIKSTSGQAFLGQSDLLQATRAELKTMRRQIQIIFQDPFASLNPRFSVREIIDEGLKIHEPTLSADARDKKISQVLEEVGLSAEARFRYPHEFSGGQRQRIAIARAIVLRPKILILDEATSALDVSIQAQVLNLLQEIQAKYNLAYIFITHNLGVVRYVADQVAVMYLGKIVEQGSADNILGDPSHPYTKKLLGSVPTLKKGATLPDPLLGDVPSSMNPPSGCAFHPRCPLKRSLDAAGKDSSSCSTHPPELSKNGSSMARCHFISKDP
jgi:peptide/nickel transport system ATP-binding protein